jgi:hypothetical protein
MKRLDREGGGWPLVAKPPSARGSSAENGVSSVLAGERHLPCTQANAFAGLTRPTEFTNRLVAIARGEQEYFDPSGVPTATEACKSNALMRCCKDLGIASELW